MPKKKTKRKVRTVDVVVSEPEPVAPLPPPAPKKSNSVLGIVLFILILAGIFLVRKGYIVAAVVNGKPIYTWTLNRALLSNYGAKTLDRMITEQLIAQEADKAGVSVTQKDVEERENELVKSVGSDVKLDDLLRFQGISREDFDNQVRLQVAAEKILGKGISFSDTEVEQYLATNSARFTATDSAKRKADAKKALVDQEIGKKIEGWVGQLREKAKIMRLL